MLITEPGVDFPLFCIKFWSFFLRSKCSAAWSLNALTWLCIILRQHGQQQTSQLSEADLKQLVSIFLSSFLADVATIRPFQHVLLLFSLSTQY